jgi:hypothetical protein
METVDNRFECGAMHSRVDSPKETQKCLPTCLHTAPRQQVSRFPTVPTASTTTGDPSYNHIVTESASVSATPEYGMLYHMQVQKDVNTVDYTTYIFLSEKDFFLSFHKFKKKIKNMWKEFE